MIYEAAACKKRAEWFGTKESVTWLVSSKYCTSEDSKAFTSQAGQHLDREYQTVNLSLQEEYLVGQKNDTDHGSLRRASPSHLHLASIGLAKVATSL